MKRFPAKKILYAFVALALLALIIFAVVPGLFETVMSSFGMRPSYL